MILEAAAEEGSVILEPQLETILNSLHAQVYKYERLCLKHRDSFGKAKF